MVFLQNTAEGGSPSITVTPANSGGDSGDAWDAVSQGDGSVVYSDEHSQKGTLSYLITGAESSMSYLEWDVTNSTECAIRFYVRFVSMDLQYITRMMTEGGTGTRLHLLLQSNGQLQIQNTLGSTVASSSGTLSTNVWYRIELTMVGDDTSTGEASLRVYEGDSETAISDMNLDPSGENFGSGGVGRVRYGSVLNSGSITGYFDDIAFEPNTVNLIGPSSGEPDPLATPQVTIEETSNPTTVGGTDGTADASWPAVTGADGGYRIEIAPGLNATTGFTVLAESHATTSYQATGLSDGDHTLGVTAKP